MSSGCGADTTLPQAVDDSSHPPKVRPLNPEQLRILCQVNTPPKVLRKQRFEMRLPCGAGAGDPAAGALAPLGLLAGAGCTVMPIGVGAPTVTMGRVLLWDAACAAAPPSDASTTDAAAHPRRDEREDQQADGDPKPHLTPHVPLHGFPFTLFRPEGVAQWIRE